MLFLNTALVLGALGILIPIIIHLLNRQSNRIVNWGAMNFLLESLAIRNRRIQLEEALLMATRCLLVGLLALALARPFIPPGSTIPWMVVLPLLLLSVVGIGVAVVLHNEPKWRFWIGLLSLLILALCVLLVLFEKKLNLSRFNPAARQDIALIIDGSTSMMMQTDGVSNFDRAVEEAREIVKRAPRGHAFSLILAGPSPSGKVLDPTTDRAELETVLDEMAPLDGPMATYHALTLASLSLARGDNQAKQIILLSDEQDVGWETGKTGRWNFLRDAFKNLPSAPQIMIRKMPLPDYVRNLAVTEVALSREIVGVDRPVEVSVTVENTGNEAVTPGALVLQVDGGRDYRDKSLGQIQPGEMQTVKFYHQFADRGAHSMTATLEVTDDIAEDNRGAAAINVAGKLNVLLVDGRANENFLDRAATFSAIALAPSRLTLNPELQPNTPPESDEESDDFYFTDPTLDPIQFLVEPKVIPPGQIGAIADFSPYDVIMLADVPRLPSSKARELAEFVESGGGLFVVAGQKTIPSFYNDWRLDSDTPFLPAKLADNLTLPEEGEGFSPSPQTLTHPALQKVADPAKSDFSETVFTNYRGQTIPDSLKNATSVGARLNNGEILLTSRNVGRGKVVLLGTSLDTQSGNLVTRQAFLPFIHELTYQLANPAAYDLNLDPGWEVNIGLTARKGSVIGEGLNGEYFASHKAQVPSYTHQDKAIQFNWRNGSPAPGIPADHFKIRWTGKIKAPQSDTYRFSADVDDHLEVRIDNQRTPKYSSHGRTSAFLMDAGRWYDFHAEYIENTGDAKVALYWESRKTGRQIVPPNAFRTFASPAGETITGSQNNLAEYPVDGPGGVARTAKISSTENGSILKLEGDIASGLYKLKIPEGHRAYFSDFLRTGDSEIPFTVKRDSSESHLTRLSEADYGFIEQFVTLAQPQTLEELIGFLNGNQFGQELWKWLAMGAFFFLLAEIVLSRWIAKSRRMGEEISVEFEARQGPTDAFQEQLVKMGKA